MIRPPPQPLFDGLDPRQRQIATEGMGALTFRTGQRIFAQGDPAGSFYVLEDGRLRVTQVTEQGQQIIVRIVHPGELFGFAPALGRDTFPGTCEALVPCRVLVWPRSRWEAVLGAAPALSASIVRAVGRKLDEAHARLRDIATEEAPQRIANVLLRLAADAGAERGPTGVEIPFPLSRQDVAEMSGTTVHTASRIMARWQVEGVLHPARRRVVIARPDALQAIADASQ